MHVKKIQSKAGFWNVFTQVRSLAGISKIGMGYLCSKCLPKSFSLFFVCFEGFKVLDMSFDRFLLAVESCDLSQADKSVFFPKAE